MDDRVKYYPPTDLFFGHNLSKIEAIEVPTFEAININDAIEFFQIKRYFDTGTRSKTWSDEAYEEYKAKCESLSRLTKRFFNQLSDDNIIDYYNSIEMGYHSDFWFLFDNCKLFNKIKNETFEALINGDKISPHDLFLHKNIVQKYGNELWWWIGIRTISPQSASKTQSKSRSTSTFPSATTRILSMPKPFYF